MKGRCYMLEVVKQGTTSKGFVWVLGKLDMGGLVIQDLFNTNSKEELDKTKPVKVKKVIIRRNREDNNLRFFIEL